MRDPFESMTFPFRHIAIMCLLLGAHFTHALAENPVQSISNNELVKHLRRGGFNIYFRHEATDWTQSDHINKAGDWLSCDGSRVRQLSDAGRQRAMSTGQAIRALGIPVSEIIASPYCRTMQTARLMKLGKVDSSTDVMNLRVAEYFGGRPAIISTARALLASAPDTDSNRVIVAHGNVAQAATPVYPGEGEGIVFQPDGKGSFTFVGRLTPEDWSQLMPRKSE